MQYFNIIFHQTKVELQEESKRFFLGMFWWFLDPLLYIMVFFILFSAGLRFGSGGIGYMVKLVVAVSVWRLFTGTLPRAAGSLIANRGLMNQVSLPAWIFPMQSFFYSFFQFLILLLTLFIFIGLTGTMSSLSYVAMFPFVLLVYILITLGLSFIAAALVPFLPDLKFIIANAITFIFFLSGIFFDISSFPSEKQEIFYLNPFAVIMQSTKDVLIGNQEPMWTRLIIIGLYSLLLILFGLWLMKRFNHTYPKLTRG